LNGARAKANDAKVKSQLTSLKILAEKYYDENGTYGNVCTTGGIVDNLIKNIPAGIDKYCWDSGVDNPNSSFAVAVEMESKPDTAFCVDSSGAADEFSGKINNGGGIGNIVDGIYKCH
jgi:hypothetical protein